MVFECAVGIFGLLIRLLETFTVSVVEPAMIGTAQAVLFWYSQNQRHAPVRALRADEPRSPLFIPIENQVFAKYPHRFGRPLDQLGASRHGIPVAAQQFAHRRAAPDLCKQLIFFTAQHKSRLPLTSGFELRYRMPRLVGLVSHRSKSVPIS